MLVEVSIPYDTLHKIHAKYLVSLKTNRKFNLANIYLIYFKNGLVIIVIQHWTTMMSVTSYPLFQVSPNKPTLNMSDLARISGSPCSQENAKRHLSLWQMLERLIPAHLDRAYAHIYPVHQNVDNP